MQLICWQLSHRRNVMQCNFIVHPIQAFRTSLNSNITYLLKGGVCNSGETSSSEYQSELSPGRRLVVEWYDGYHNYSLCSRMLEVLPVPWATCSQSLLSTEWPDWIFFERILFSVTFRQKTEKGIQIDEDAERSIHWENLSRETEKHDKCWCLFTRGLPSWFAEYRNVEHYTQHCKWSTCGRCWSDVSLHAIRQTLRNGISFGRMMFFTQ